MHEVVTDLAQQERERKASEEARRLAKQAQQLERILTDDFRSLQMELEKIRRLARLRQGEMIDALVPGLGRVQTDSKLGGPEQGDGTRGELVGIWGSSSSDVFAVGDYGTILYYDGASWSQMESSTDATLSSFWGNSASDIFSVGE